MQQKNRRAFPTMCLHGSAELCNRPSCGRSNDCRAAFAQKLPRADIAQCIHGISTSTGNVQQQEASHDADIFVKAIHAVDLFSTLERPISMPDKRRSQCV